MSFQGLVVPVLRDVQNMNYLDIERGINELGEKVNYYFFLISQLLFSESSSLNMVATELMARVLIVLILSV